MQHMAKNVVAVNEGKTKFMVGQQSDIWTSVHQNPDLTLCLVLICRL